MGLPAAVLGCIRAARRARDGSDPDRSALPEDSRRVLTVLEQTGGKLEVVALARTLRVPEHTLLDHCEVLFAERLVEPADDGMALALST